MTTTTQSKADLKWLEIDPATLPASAVKLWDAYKAAYKASNNQRQAFEALMQDLSAKNGSTDGKTTELRFGYRFGKLAVAIAPKEAKSTASRKAIAFDKVAA